MSESSNITIAIPVYERLSYFNEALLSACRQTLRCPVLVVDNASSHAGFESLVKGLNDPLVSYLRQESNVGMEGNWNSCINDAKTDWVTILHDDDLLYPGYVETISRFIVEYPDVSCVAVTCNGGDDPPAYLEHSKGNLSWRNVDWRDFLWQNLSPFPGVAFRRDIGIELGGFDARLHPSADLDFWCRMTERVRTVLLSRELAYYRISKSQGSNSLAGEIADQTYKFRQRLLKKYGRLNVVSDFLVHEATLGTFNFYRDTYDRDYMTEDFDPNKFRWIRRIAGLRKIAHEYGRFRLKKR